MTSKSSLKQTIVRPAVGIGVAVRNKGCVLVGRRVSEHGRETWSFPGGHLEFGEEFATCAKREVFEESGLSITNVQYAAVTNDIQSEIGRHYVTLHFISDLVVDVPSIAEVGAFSTWGWFRWSDLPQPLFYPTRAFVELNIDPFAT